MPRRTSHGKNKRVDDLRAAVARKKAELDRLRGRLPGGLANLEHAHDLELTYTSNAIEGNTLSAAETTLVIEHGITIGGKPSKITSSARPLRRAALRPRSRARRPSLSEGDIRNLQPRHAAFEPRSPAAMPTRVALS